MKIELQADGTLVVTVNENPIINRVLFEGNHARKFDGFAAGHAELDRTLRLLLGKRGAPPEETDAYLTRLFRQMETAFPDALARGFGEGTRRYGLLLDTLRMRFVNDFCYAKFVPVGAPFVKNVTVPMA